MTDKIKPVKFNTPLRGRIGRNKEYAQIAQAVGGLKRGEGIPCTAPTNAHSSILLGIAKHGVDISKLRVCSVNRGKSTMIVLR